MAPTRGHRLLALSLLLAACGGPPERPSAKEMGIERPLRGAPISLSTLPEVREIALFEDRRDPGDGRLATLLTHEDPTVRERAAVALGRMPYPEFGSEVSAPLSRALDDPAQPVRLAAAFGLGVRGDPEGLGVLAARRHDPDPEMRARIVEAMGRLADPSMYEEIALALRDVDLRVRIEAAEATALWDPEAESAKRIDRALLDALHPYVLSDRDRELGRRAVESDLAWRILYALSRRGASLGRGPFLEYLGSRLPLERLFSARGLGHIAPDEDCVQALVQVVETEQDRATPDWRVVCEAATSLGAQGLPQGLPTLYELLEHDNTNVRVAAYQALGRFPRRRADVLPRLRQGLLDVSRPVRMTALVSLSSLLPAEDVLEFLAPAAADDEAIVRAGAAEALANVDSSRSIQLLERLARDPSPFVATRAIAALGAHLEGSPEARELLHGVLRQPDNGLRLAAVTALREAPSEADLLPLAQCMKESTGDVSGEIAFGVVEVLGGIGSEAARTLVERTLQDPRAHVRRVARRVLAESFGTKTSEASLPPLETEPPPLAGEDYPAYERNPLVEVRTTRGAMIFELFPAEAPIHVHNFLELAARNHYDQLVFHRVVPDFVVQGGDYRGDGNGAAPWRGESLRHEFTPRKYARGALGMPRNEDPDSGGSQFFVTHRPTPHLDGRYTLFGELRAGGEALDRLEIGDRILGVRLLERP